VIEPELERYLARLERALGGLRRGERERALREARDHVLCAADDRASRGRGRSESVRAAIEAFGAVESIAASYARPARSRGELLRAGTVAIAAVAVALAIAPTGGRLGQILIPTSHAAVGECAGRWNAAPPATGYRLAFVSAPAPACEVVLHDARHARVFRLSARDGRWHAIVPTVLSGWPLARVPASLRAHPYAVEPDGRIGRRLQG
jgi:hypothetical protein